jgi:Uma2 family endonuclease
MSAIKKTALYSFDEFCAVIGDDQKADLIDGVIYVASPDNTDANELNGWLAALMHSYVRELDLGKIYISRVAYRLDRWNGPEPDL